MNSYGVLTTQEEVQFFGGDDFETLREEGTFRLTLRFRSWYKKAYSMGLICHFEDEDGRKLNLYCFRHTRNGVDMYNPKRCLIDFEKVEDGTVWDCTMELNKKGNAEWVDAKIVE